jgi:hypothetical protein
MCKLWYYVCGCHTKGHINLDICQIFADSPGHEVAVTEISANLCNGTKPGCLGVPHPGKKRYFGSTHSGRIIAGSATETLADVAPRRPLPSVNGDGESTGAPELSDEDLDLEEEIAGLERKIRFLKDRRFHDMARSREEELARLREEQQRRRDSPLE